MPPTQWTCVWLFHLRSAKREAGFNFEIRSRFWDNDEGYLTTRKDWDVRTVYVETLPVKCKTLDAPCRFILGLLPSPAEAVFLQSSTGVTRIAEPPKLKSFALVAVKTVKDAESLVAAWPWKRLKDREARTRPTQPVSVPYMLQSEMGRAECGVCRISSEDRGCGSESGRRRLS
ncbi:hypothetical protein C8F01DRAFT_3465 [Mycena amicta]|nr:hypothetical protein C8F01DRAFT_3465 [Mycena amicta]